MIQRALRNLGAISAAAFLLGGEVKPPGRQLVHDSEYYILEVRTLTNGQQMTKLLMQSWTHFARRTMANRLTLSIS